MNIGVINKQSLPATSLIPYSKLVEEFKMAPHGKLFCLHGDRSVFRLSLYAASHVLLAGLAYCIGRWNQPL